ncbi:MAG: hypothetical protein H8E17_11985 [Deltaproteobacteria bacterium]|nr:hypothetical protein [Deltaproteobacteria bacterium]
MLIWGSRPVTKNLGEVVKRYCEVCGKKGTARLYLKYKEQHFWFIYGAISEKRYLILCDLCKQGWVANPKTIEKRFDKHPIPFMRRNGCLILILGTILCFILLFWIGA